MQIHAELTVPTAWISSRRERIAGSAGDDFDHFPIFVPNGTLPVPAGLNALPHTIPENLNV
jgi:hypothetical protein